MYPFREAEPSEARGGSQEQVIAQLFAGLTSCSLCRNRRSRTYILVHLRRSSTSFLALLAHNVQFL